MRRILLTFTISLTISLGIVAVASSQNDNSSKQSNPLLGTWKISGTYDSESNLRQPDWTEIGYETFIENGKFFAMGFKKNFPQTDVNPKSLEEYEEIVKNSWGWIGDYKVDLQHKKVCIEISHDLNPKSIGHKMTVNFEIVGDTAIYWIENEKKLHKWLKVQLFWSFCNFKINKLITVGGSSLVRAANFIEGS